MNVSYKTILNTDDLGNMNFISVKQYKFDYYLFDYIKTFLFNRKKREKSAILSLEYNSKYKIRNQKKYGLRINNEKFLDYTENEIIQITPTILGLNVATNKVFINYTVKNNVYICDIYDNVFQLKEELVCSKKLNTQLDGTIIQTFEVHNSSYLLKTDKKLATIYLDKKYSYLIQDIINKNDEKIFYKFYKPIYKNLNEEELIELMNKYNIVHL